jgi:hypothetical protein
MRKVAVQCLFEVLSSNLPVGTEKNQRLVAPFTVHVLYFIDKMETASFFRHCHVSTKVHDVTRMIVTLYWPIWRSWDRASWYVSTVKPTRCKIFEFTEHHSTCFGRSLRPSSGVQDCTYSIRYMSNRLAGCLLAGTRWNCSSKQAVSQLINMTYTRCCVYCLELLMMDGNTVRNM